MQLTTLTLVCAAAMAAQTHSPAHPDIGDKLRQNSESLKPYTYKRRTTLEVKGQPRGSRLDMVRDVDGRAEVTPLETPQRQSASAGGLRGRMIQKKTEEKREELKQETQELTGLLRQYLSADTMTKLIETASISRANTGPNADLKVAANGLVSPSDSFTLMWNTAGQRPESIQIATQLKDKPVRITMNYAVLSNGLFYDAHTVVALPQKEISLVLDRFDYTL